ncbi:hypothetical protein TSOC_006138 [Tetrabaena socialis]|uniref:CBM20 domain-containing protein n=1 Tax=Tetrabaena socialis TaxID=47790 RepID=A0A2J8A4I5_9CHLO|nr:hypothetical protein TSOC_006138 [Tetrabaena socialis]|eukprot:PNH07413.1 hypothetical protein TSOC_006138 [Tetrabaena socialis]
MHWGTDNTWTCSVPLAAGSAVNCKYVVVDGAGRAVRWQEGDNMVVAIPAAFQGLPVMQYDVQVSWCKAFQSFGAIPLTSAAAVAASFAGRAAAPTPAQAALPPVMAWAVAKGASAATATAELPAQPSAATAAQRPSAPPPQSALPRPAEQPVPRTGRMVETIMQAAGGASKAAPPPSLPPATPARAAAAAAPPPPSDAAVAALPVASAAPAAPATPPPAPLRASFQLTPPTNDQPMSMLLQSGRPASPAVKISLSSSFSRLMEMPAAGRAAAAGAGAATSSSAASASAQAPASSSEKLTPRPLQSHPLDVAIKTSAPATSAATSVAGGAPARSTSPSPAARAALASASPPASPTTSTRSHASRRPHHQQSSLQPPSPPVWGLEYDMYATLYGAPYMHNAFDLDAYAQYEQMPYGEQPSAPAAAAGAALRAQAAAPGKDLLETAVQAARGSPPLPVDALPVAPAAAVRAPEHAAAAVAAPPLPIPDVAAAAAAEIATAAVAAAAVAAPALASAATSSVADWAGRTLFELSRASTDSDDEAEETADSEAAVAHALCPPPTGSDMTALLKQLGSSLGKSVRMRDGGADAAAADLLELDRTIALAASKLYRQRDNLLVGFVRKETRRQLMAAAAGSAGGRARVTPM